MLFAYLFGQTGQRDTASDLLQELFVKVWQHIGEVEAMCDERRRPWLMRLARNAVIDSRRRSSVRAHLNLPSPAADPAAVSHEAEVVDRLCLNRLDRAIQELPLGLRTVLAMSVAGELSSEEIGEALGRPAATVRFQLAEARRKLVKKVGL